jgi:hypothetical protein
LTDYCLGFRATSVLEIIVIPDWKQVARELKKMGVGLRVLNDDATMDLVYKLGYKSEDEPLEGTPFAGERL